MKKYEKKALIILLGSIFIIGNTVISNAALQGNGRTQSVHTIEQWILQIRQMETDGQALGLTETIDEDSSDAHNKNKNNFLNSTSGSNDIDVHMEKNIEFGAMAILSASDYGNPNKIENGETTTGNATGVVMKLNQEWVSAGSITESKPYKYAIRRYKDKYTKDYARKIGDAISETKGWHGSGASQWIWSSTQHSSAYGNNGPSDYRF